jgi:hypothetical protein
MNFWLPTRPYSLVDAINRAALATGSCRAASIGSHADYNGHRVDFCEPNSFKRYWTCYYTWAGTVTIGRGSLVDCLNAAKREYDRGALGASAQVRVDSEEDAEACLAAGFVPWSKEIQAVHEATWRTPMHAEVHHALRDERNGYPGCVGLLANATSMENYQAQKDALRMRASFRLGR